ncbi:MAG: phosphatidate cytidylyltransferase [Alphaproteobacteria bacterium]|nr:phosphatidate cytidylyltransferase [Alphaproteobacteria bacterium]
MAEHISPNRTAAMMGPQTAELVKRVISAVILGSIGIAATLAGAWPLAVIVGIVSSLLAWEWGRLVRNCAFDDLLFVHIGALLIAIALATAGMMGYAILALLAGFIAIAIRRSREYTKLSAFGVPYVGIAAIGIIWLRSGELGSAAILFVFACVWAHDSFAMLFGRALGGPRLWPSVSPKKTWSGAIAGLFASTFFASLGVLVLPGTQILWLAPLGFILGLAALLGDLAESSLKRLGRVENASGLIPGHGGFLDRMDGAVASFAVACLIAYCLNADAPAKALLLGH